MASPSSDINLNIVIRKANAQKAPYYAAEAVQLILIKYFTLQLLSIKNHIPELSKLKAIEQTRKWLGSKCHKQIILVDVETWSRIETDFVVGQDLFFIKDIEIDINPALVFWPNLNEFFPDYLLNV